MTARQACARPQEILHWNQRALCKSLGDTMFYPVDGETTGARTRREQAARAICRRCEVAPDCLQYAFETNDQFGIWGGLTERERARTMDRSGSGDDANPTGQNESRRHRRLGFV